MLHALDHAIVAVRDLAGAEKAFTALLGREPSWRGLHPEAGTANVLYRLRNTYLELLAAEGQGGAGALLSRHLEERGEGLVGLAFATEDVAAVRERWADRGLEPAPLAEGHGRERDTGAERRWRTAMLPAHRTRGLLVFAIEHRSPLETLPSAPLAAEATSAVDALDHVVVRSADPEAAIALYGDALGLRLALDRRFEEWGVRLLFFRVGGLTVEVASALGSADSALSGAPPLAKDLDALWGASWQVADVDAARERVAAAGFGVSEVRAGRKPGTRVCTVRDEPCGVATLLLQPARPSGPRGA